MNAAGLTEFEGCNIIEGQLTILSLPSMNQELHPQDLEVLSTVQKITDGFSIAGKHDELISLSFLRNLESIGGVLLITDASSTMIYYSFEDNLDLRQHVLLSDESIFTGTEFFEGSEEWNDHHYWEQKPLLRKQN